MVQNEGLERLSQAQIFDDKFQTLPITTREDVDDTERNYESRVPESLHEKQST